MENNESATPLIAPDQVSLDYEAAKQLRMELSMIKGRVLSSNTFMNSILVTQLTMVLRGLIAKYNNAGLLKGENVTLVLNGHGRYAGFRFAYSQGLHVMMKKIEADAKAAMQQQTETKTEEKEEIK